MSLTDLLKSMLRARVPDHPLAAPTAGAAPAKSEASRQEATRLLDAGNVAENGGNPQEAFRLYEAALALAPDFPRAHLNRANVLMARGEVADAIAGYATAIDLDPSYFAAHFNLGLASLPAGDPQQALASFDRTIALKPDFVDAHIARGNLLEELGQVDEAIASYRLALRLRPDFAEAHNNLGIALLRAGRIEEAVTAGRRAVELRPDYAEGYGNLANALKALGRMDESLAQYERALAINPDYIEARSGRLFGHNYLSNRPVAQSLDDARRYGALVAGLAQPATAWRNDADPERVLRVGFVSGDLYDHPVGYFFEAVLAALHARTPAMLELHVYANNLREDATTARLRASCHAWHMIAGHADEQVAGAIRDDGIDILIDLSGHTGLNRLPVFAWKPAPVQVTWLGYFSTTGVAAIDYVIADPWAVPEGAETEFTETVWRLPETRLCFTPPGDAGEVAPLPALSEGAITFGCFSHLTKVNDGVIALWARVLAAVPDSRLLLKAPQLTSSSVRAALLARFDAQGIGADRLILEGPSPRADYLAAYEDVDIMLDTFPYPGGTTTAEAVWMGVPVLSMTGDTFLSRQGVSLLTNAGLPDWIAVDGDDFVARAVAQAGDRDRLAALRRDLRRRVRASPLFDAPRFAAHFEQALRAMWRMDCEKRRPGR